MITFIPLELTGPVWKKIDLGGGDFIEIAVRRPTLGEQLATLETGVESQREFTLRASIVDWRGVQDDKGQQVPYSWPCLNQLCANYSGAIWEILTAVQEVRDGKADDQKNLPLPSNNGGTTTIGEIIVSTESLEPISSSNESSDSVPGSA